MTGHAEHWSCQNDDLEIRCAVGVCTAISSGEQNGFTPMAIEVADNGKVSVCAYTGCWEGEGKTLGTEDFLVVAGHDLPFSTAPESQAKGMHVVVAVDRHDGFGAVKAGGFAQPIRCERPRETPQPGTDAPKRR